MVRIEGVIGEDVTLMDVIAAVKNEPADKAVEVLVNSPGGYVDEGLKIYNYLRGLRYGCNTTCDGECASMGSIIFMAGKERRAGCDIMIHNPFVGALVLENATADEIQEEADRLRELQDTLAEIYIKGAKLDRNAIQPLMDAETWITPAMAVNMGIATSVYTPARKMQGKAASGPIALAFKREQTQKNDSMKTISEIIALGKKILGGGVKALTLKAADGTELYVEREEGEIQVGDIASPDGEFQLEDGRLVIVKDGVIAEIKTGDGPDHEHELEDLRSENAVLKATIAQQQAFIEKYKSVIEEYDEKKAAESHGYKGQGRDFGKGTEPGGKTAEEKRAEYVAKIKEERRKAAQGK